MKQSGRMVMLDVERGFVGVLIPFGRRVRSIVASCCGKHNKKFNHQSTTIHPSQWNRHTEITTKPLHNHSGVSQALETFKKSETPSEKLRLHCK